MLRIALEGDDDWTSRIMDAAGQADSLMRQDPYYLTRTIPA